MDFERIRHPEWMELRIGGRLDAASSAEVESEIDKILRGGELKVRLQMQEVDYISSAGIRVLIKYAKLLQDLGGEFFVERPSPMVRSVIDMTGLSQLLIAPQEEMKETGRAPDQHQREERHYGPLHCTVYPRIPAPPPLVCHLVGNPDKLIDGRFGPQDVTELSLPPGKLAVGLGAFGKDFEDCRGRFGEFLAAGGAAVSLACEKANTPDYLVTRGSLVPKVECLYALEAEGAFSHFVRFDTEENEPGTPLSRIVESVFDILATNVAAIAMVAETAGLVGASLKQSPLFPERGAGLFDFPAIRQWLSFTPERVCDRCTVFVAGVVTGEPPGPFEPFVRPLGRPRLPAGHFHAAAFTYRALPKGEIALEPTLATLFEEQSLTSMLHLLNDSRSIGGAGESLFVRGAMWIGHIGSVSTLPPRKDTP